MEFTSSHYLNLIKLASKKFKFINFKDNYNIDQNLVLWRHDIDFSPQRALFMAQQEAELGLSTNYFVQVTSIYYNILEPEITKIIKKIHSLGHHVGLHFDPSVCDENELDIFEKRVKFESSILKEIIRDDINVFSIHNPTTLKGVNLDELRHFGFINATSSKLLANFKYCSDSNGYWRYDVLDQLILDKNIKQLYVLTHPVWWQEKQMSPRAKIERSIEGRSIFVKKYYDQLLNENNRKNIK